MHDRDAAGHSRLDTGREPFPPEPPQPGRQADPPPPQQDFFDECPSRAGRSRHQPLGRDPTTLAAWMRSTTQYHRGGPGAASVPPASLLPVVDVSDAAGASNKRTRRHPGTTSLGPQRGDGGYVAHRCRLFSGHPDPGIGPNREPWTHGNPGHRREQRRGQVVPLVGGQRMIGQRNTGARVETSM